MAAALVADQALQLQLLRALLNAYPMCGNPDEVRAAIAALRAAPPGAIMGLPFTAPPPPALAAAQP